MANDKVKRTRSITTSTTDDWVTESLNQKPVGNKLSIINQTDPEFYQSLKGR